jgi:hypothetical protein
MPQDLSLPVTFRGEIIQKLLDLLKQGESCSLIGVGSSGKSNVVRHINRADVREYYLGGHAQNVLYLYVNCTELTETLYTAHGLYCLILDVMRKAVRDHQPGAGEQHTVLRALWKEAIESDSDALARSNLEDAFQNVFRTGVEQVFISLDDFDLFFAKAPASAVNSLRAFRDDYKVQLAYVTVTRRELGYLRDPSNVEDFLELVVPTTTFPAVPYSEPDARFMIKRLAGRENPPRTLSDLEEVVLMGLSGRHAGLLRMIYKVTRDQFQLMSPNLPDLLRGHPAIVEECEKIWSSLIEDEQHSLEAVASECQSAGEDLGALLAKGVVRTRPDETYAVFSPVFARFVVDRLRRQWLPITLMPGQQVRVYGRDVTNLNDIEYRLLSFFVDQYPKSVTWDQLLEEMHKAEAGQPQGGGPPNRRLRVCLDEIKHKIEFEDQKYVLRLPDGRVRLLREPCS